MIVDLGCGTVNRGDVRIDRTLEGTTATHACWLGFERIPFEDNVADQVCAYDFLEHVPFLVYAREDGEWVEHRPGIFLIEEVWRVLKPGGIFDTYTPCAPRPEAFQDPTHVAFWTERTPLYFTAGHALRTRYNVQAVFKVLEHSVEKGTHLKCVMEAVK